MPDKQKVKKIVNVNYLIEDPMYDTAFRSDVQRVETNGKLANKVPEDFLREEEFCNVTTPFRDVIQIMLVKKFETFFTNLPWLNALKRSTSLRLSANSLLNSVSL
jgi:hypothetical protein